MKILAAIVLTLGLCGFAFSDKAAIAKGKEVYNGLGGCMACHGTTGKGDGPAAPALNPKPRSFEKGVFLLDTDGDGKTGTDADLLNVLKNGAAKYKKADGTPGSPLMVGRPGIPLADVKNLIAFIRSLEVAGKKGVEKAE